jgi:hypothetical protein
VDANGLTLEQGAKVSAGRGAQRTEEELRENIAAQQFAVGAVKFIMQATGETTIEKMNRDASLAFTSKTKALVKSLTGSESTDDNANANPNLNPNPNDNTGGDNQGGTNTGGDSGSIIDGTDEG